MRLYKISKFYLQNLHFMMKYLLVKMFQKEKISVILISIVQHDKTITGEKEKLERIQFYNDTKYGVDIMNKLLVR